MLDHPELVGALEKLEDRRAHRALDEIDESLGVDVVRRADEQRAAAALIVGRDRDELENLLDRRRVEPGVGEPFCRAPGDEPLRAGTGVDPGRLDADHPPCPVLRRRGDADQRHHLLRRQPGDRRHPSHRPASRDPNLGSDGALALDDVAGDHLRDLLHDPCLAEHDVADRLVEHLGEARHVDALLPAREVDGALDLGRHHRLGVAAANANCLLNPGHTGPRKRELDGWRRRLHVRREVRELAHVRNVAAAIPVVGTRAVLPFRLSSGGAPYGPSMPALYRPSPMPR